MLSPFTLPRGYRAAPERWHDNGRLDPRMTDWTKLDAELAAWADAGRVASLWWRDDDATRPTHALERLLEMRRRHDLPIALAVIPARARKGLAERLRREQHIVVWQHGWAHVDHAPAGAPKAEIGPHRSVLRIIGELLLGRMWLNAIFGRKGWQKVLVPPFNEVADTVIDVLPVIGYRGVSAGRDPRPPRRAGTMFNAHVDIMAWSTNTFAGEPSVIGTLVKALRLRRERAVDDAEPVGILTHHLAHDEAAWAFADALLARLKSHPAVRFRDPDSLFS